MNLVKKSVLVFSFVLACIPAFQTTLCTNSIDDDFEAYFNGLDSGAGIDDDFSLPSTTKGFDPLQTINILLDFNIINILKQPFFLRTNPINKRNILDQPMAFLDRRYRHDDWVIGSNIFYNEINRNYFSQHSDSIDSYIGITQEGFLSALNEGLKQAKKLTTEELSVDPFDIILLLKDATISERQLGALFWGQKRLYAWNFSWKLPFYYLERNYWLTEEQQTALEEKFGSSSEDQKAYVQHHFIVADKVGFGDLRLTCDTPIFESNDDRFDMRAGGQLTIPTAFAFTHAIAGNQFKLHERKQNLDLADLTGYHLNEILSMVSKDEPENNPDQAFCILKNLGVQALDTINAQLLEAPLGNSGHIGIGGYYRSTIPLSVFVKRRWAQNFLYKGGMSLEYLLPKTEQRMFVKKIDLDAFDSRDFSSDEESYQNMIFLEEQIVDKLFPYVYPTMVHPGIVFHWTGNLSFESYHWLFSIGTDTWVNSPEAFGTITAPSDILPKLNICTAKRLMGYQWKMLGDVGYKFQTKKHTWILSLGADSSFSNSGIGNEYTISLNLEVDF